MRRNILSRLEKWKNSPRRKPLIIRGARQVGKTWVMKEFGRSNFDKIIYINFEKDKQLKDLFIKDFNVERILMAFQVQSGIVPEREETIILLDEIQEAEGALTALKYFYEEVPEYHILCAGSLLGITMDKSSFPVGKVDFLELHPLSFSEYLMAVGKDNLLKLLKNHDWPLLETFRNEFIYLLKQYYYVGGMPEVVDLFIEEGDYEEVRRVHDRILTAYELDFSKHAPPEIIPRIRMLWNSLPAQLSRENKKFVYGLVKSGARAREYEIALSWLEDYGLLHRVHRITKPGLPLKTYIDFKAFKIYTLDVGLLCTLTDLHVSTLLDGNALFAEFKGALTEQYVLQQFIAENGINPYYWSNDRSTGEVDFIIEKDSEIYPVEVKAEENLQSKSLKSYYKNYNPKWSVRSSLSNYRKEDWLINIPLYAIREIINVL